MNLERKLAILADAAKYDASCASSGSIRQGRQTGNTSIAGICHSWSSDGRCIALLKLLLSNVCRYDCAYCINRRSNDLPRATFNAAEVVRLTMDFYRRNCIEGLFLSSALFVTPDQVMVRMIEIARRLRGNEGFGGYIHLKAIPGAGLDLIRQAGCYADRVSINIELPSETSLMRLAPEKRRRDIVAPMAFLSQSIRENRAERQKDKQAPRFAPAGHSTQLIVGASPETDRQIIRLGEALYRQFALRRIYFSAYIPVNRYDSRLPSLEIPPLLREHRLYQADWLLRYYGFSADELLDERHPHLDHALDPKAMWAIRNFHRFPIEVSTADYEWLLRVPGIGVVSARRILSARRFQGLTFDDLGRLGVVLKRAALFITCGGKHRNLHRGTVESVRRTLLASTRIPAAEQLTLGF